MVSVKKYYDKESWVTLQAHHGTIFLCDTTGTHLIACLCSENLTSTEDLRVEGPMSIADEETLKLIRNMVIPDAQRQWLETMYAEEQPEVEPPSVDPPPDTDYLELMNPNEEYTDLEDDMDLMKLLSDRIQAAQDEESTESNQDSSFEESDDMSDYESGDDEVEIVFPPRPSEQLDRPRFDEMDNTLTLIKLRTTHPLKFYHHKDEKKTFKGSRVHKETSEYAEIRLRLPHMEMLQTWKNLVLSPDLHRSLLHGVFDFVMTSNDTEINRRWLLTYIWYLIQDAKKNHADWFAIRM
jgi:hypothetical protein